MTAPTTNFNFTDYSFANLASTCVLPNQSVNAYQNQMLVMDLVVQFETSRPSNGNNQDIFLDNQLIASILRENIRVFNFVLLGTTDYGYIEKKDLPALTTIVVRAGLLGNLFCLISYLKKLKSLNLLDENYRCHPSTHLLFLGNHIGNNPDSLYTLTLLLALKLENPNQITLIRGEQDSLEAIQSSQHDLKSPFNNFLYSDIENSTLLYKLFRTFPLTTFISHEGKQREYIAFTSRLFELYLNPKELLESPQPVLQFLVPSHPLQKDGPNHLKSIHSKKKSHPKIANFHQLCLKEAKLERTANITAYTTGQIDTKRELSCHKWVLEPSDIKDYFHFSSGKHLLQILIRGSETGFCNHMVKDKVVAISLPDYREKLTDSSTADQTRNVDFFYKFSIAERVENWLKEGCIYHV